ncbi:hypothetical protein BAUCODRAFT_78004 [Baudoinia panamericana UAMH 10762]|uniref:F-box domain-containing protein n=1 Tax=Baudoinia panamericana (strain UAMH 10762) TaxID=717646 RepID=M2N0M8_BAUPA|nr:uncharacterized protein BAUCODRAFT_78004 [Baudoinia panamericana UAMH 10762]EMC92180.1 hypothetical protein BAUCODRAFT_78004 [Baudoinia panamericana UAMH 10762]
MPARQDTGCKETPARLPIALISNSDTARYLPLSSAATLGRGYSGNDYTILATHRARINHGTGTSADSVATWPVDGIPVELFDLTTEFLARDDVKAMRLVNQEFEKKVSRSLFRTSVVPFNTELYDMIDEETKTAGHGLRVFQGFGPHIKRFGMSFDVTEDQLSQPPAKKELDFVDSYHGSYNWPPAHYARFDNIAGLERTADETSRMKAAFQNLEIVRELALSLDNGLGWLSGPDKSIHARVFERSTPMFGNRYTIPDHQTQSATMFWAAMQDVHGCLGVLYLTCTEPGGAALDDAGTSVMPNLLRKEQREWLLEMEWAQRAFLESYMLAIIDNPAIFENVTTLRLAKLSSSFLPIIARQPFWDALPSLEDLTIHVSPDWRAVGKDDAGFAEMTAKNPSGAVTLFYGLLRQRVAPMESVTKLNIGWVSGGEQAQGLFARNNHLLPSPITQLEHSTAAGTHFSLVFKHVEHLTLSNCWVTPPTLEGIVKGHGVCKMKKLTLDSFGHAPGPFGNAPGVPALSTNGSLAHWTADHREGSWPHLINSISPGATFNNFNGTNSDPSRNHNEPPKPATNLRELEFISCGYALLQQASFDQTALQGVVHTPSAWFRARQLVLKPVMLESKDRFLGSIVPAIPLREQDALTLAWHLTLGWSNVDEAEKAMYDGCLPGGSGRFSGRIVRPS